MFYVALTLALMQGPTQTIKPPEIGASHRAVRSQKIGNLTPKIGKPAPVEDLLVMVAITEFTDAITSRHLSSIMTRLKALSVILGGSGLFSWCVPKSVSARVITAIENDPRLEGHFTTTFSARKDSLIPVNKSEEWHTVNLNQSYLDIGKASDPSIPPQVLAIFKDVKAVKRLRDLPFTKSIRYKSRKYLEVDAERVGYEVEVTVAENSADTSPSRVLRFIVMYPSQVLFRY